MKTRVSNYFLILVLSITFLIASDFQSQGEKIYQETCQFCHMEDGNGLALLITPFSADRFSHDRGQLICTVLTGLNDSLNGYFMPSFNHLDHAKIANVLNYIRQLKQFDALPFTDGEISGQRIDCR